MEIADIIFRSIFFGYVIWTFIWSYRKRRTIGSIQVEEIDQFIVRTVMIFGILHLAILILNFIDLSSSTGISIDQKIVNRAFGNYWLGFWVYPITYFGLTQLLWVRKIGNSKLPRISIALIVFVVMHLEKFVILVTSAHREYIIDGSENFPITIFGQIGLSWLLNLMIFGFFIIIGLKVKKLYNKTYE